MTTYTEREQRGAVRDRYARAATEKERMLRPGLLWG